jgi:hypothetical protein
MNRSAAAPGSDSLAEKLAPWLGGLLLALPVLIARYPPMTDLPYHESVIALLRYRNDPAFSPPGLYHATNFGHPNQLFYLVGWLVSYALPTDWTCKVLVAATVVAVAVCAGRLATYLGASRFTALAVAPVALGWTFLWGLVTNLTGLAALLFSIPILDRLAEAPSGKNAVKAIGAMALLYLAHEAAMIAACFVVVIFTLCHPLFRTPASSNGARANVPIKDTLLRASPAAFASLLYAAQALYQRHLMSPTVRSVPTTYMPFMHKLTTIPGAILGGHDLTMQLATFGLFTACLVGFAVARFRARRRDLGLGARGTLHRFRFEAFAALSLFAYFVMPYTISGATLVYHRFLPPAFSVFAVAVAPRGASRVLPRIVRFLAVVLPVGSLLLMWPEFADSDRAYKELDALLPLITEGSAVAHMELGSNAPERVYSVAGGGARALAVRGGRLLFSFADSPISPVQMTPEYQWNESLRRVAFDAYAFRPAFDCDRYKFIIAHNPGGSIPRIMERAMLPDARVIGRSGEWLLLESTHVVLPLLSPDAPLPEPHPATLRKRMKLAYQQMLEEEEPGIDPATHPPPAVFDPQEVPDIVGSNNAP